MVKGAIFMWRAGITHEQGHYNRGFNILLSDFGRVVLLKSCVSQFNQTGLKV